MTTITTEALVEKIKARAVGQDRILVAIAGPPGSGKSTLAADLAAQLGPSAAVLPMDGFHLENDQLRHMGLLQRKGAPETFDAAGLSALLRDVREEATIPFPTFDREADRTVPDAGRIGADTSIVLVEGNYLLLNTPPWSDLDGLFDLSVRIDVDRQELENRLVARWTGHGHSPESARARALGNDMKNGDFVGRNSRAPDYVIRVES